MEPQPNTEQPNFDSKNFPNYDQNNLAQVRYQNTTEQNEDKFSIPQVHPRIHFLRRLYLLLFFQLLICVIWTFCVYYFEDLHEDLSQSPSYFILLPFFVLIIILILVFSQRELFSKTPLNLFTYIAFTCLLAFSFAWLIVLDSTYILLMLVINACFISFTLLIYVLTTKTELTYQGASLFVLGAIFLVFQGFLLFTTARIDYLICGLIIDVLWGFFMIYDTQTNVSGMKYNWDKDDPFSGAVLIYADIFILFLRLCELIRQVVIRERN